ncbi:1-(5-phosphoribosyl)-5-[(5-phosphoribosylamino)methylideneamino]imidazole-4-carboxamide isomerase [Methanimicrococcus blatticola]|uniref:1-(5-phosphoribosyl)-5-[(5-phosphoribosylamino)methylideneamino] imidazole-4-carboxamide isomerase n=1 Tax=Methanimicrococcus blatticola TaxID=91560 RepID=A0A484F2S7_9EURY|nr:1-(5-phosphoribosyl)-5-[(5-phosphoribosylamino)methylideneamino]imidazole-4-carboxamide isomerase [Methanimicrococcus blatticola]MBZ3935266.1 1-(5-phosphoribosyl)-5-[(5-phosphoribosylamino)methylideneamino]imidazole-4-carboxamide isomerase [Methanimicrococcus blatticola]MCC2508636.1 1-(5-phosphoribosyl)-5-[(5-phosphoribosylamino)methylideneamino]imidazole-4-carboxamide isomerase [Methanimicrococcus blatticola]TDQ67941.1 1-(5-phosphoribosyl)-5-[(5-phosphoribosylamino)methylideneamino] imidazol
MSFQIIPAVDMKGGKCVQLVQGIPGSEMVSLDDPAATALNWVARGAKTLHLIDLDGAFEGKRKNGAIIENIIERAKPLGIEIQIGGGIRSYEDAETLLSAGADRVILTTAAMKNPQIVKDLSESFGKQAVIVGLDAKNGKIALEGWTKLSDKGPTDVAKQFEDLGAGYILFTNIDTEGLLKGVDIKPTKDLIDSVNIPVIASGGVTATDDLLKLRDAGAYGAVVGSALYTDKFTLEEAIAVLKK